VGTIRDRLQHAWNAFRNEEDRYRVPPTPIGQSYSYQPDIRRIRQSNERSIISSIYTHLGVDVASAQILHVRLDENDQFLEEIPSGLNNCLKVEANLDQAGTALRLDIAMTLFEKGVIAIVPVDTDINPQESGGFDIQTLRVGEIVQWYPQHVTINLYDERDGQRKDVTLKKSSVAIVQNPLYPVMNEPNSTLQRLIRKLNLLDVIDEQSSSGKLDLIIQLPYVIKSEARRQQAEQRRSDIEFQLKSSKYGIAYTDGTEKITQLNRPAENNLLTQVEYLTDMLYGQLGLTKEIMNGTADEKAMLNYKNRTIAPVLTAITEAMKRSFLTKTARTQRQSIEAFPDPFQLVPISEIAEIADKFTRNEILSSNEIRGIIKFKPSKDPKADELRNSNMPIMDTGVVPEEGEEDDDTIMQDAFDSLDSTLDELFSELDVVEEEG
jgi:Phage portal protein